MKKKYYLRLVSFSHPDLNSPWKEVTKDEWIKAERAAGFYPKGGGNGEATGGFGGNGVSGKIEYVKENESGTQT